MDKYTVDLDQVLNDFEYSELTDHYSRETSSDRPPVNLQPTTVTKHSINNVFHSLNEYLNTSISEKHSDLSINEENNVNFIGDFKKIDNNLKDNKENLYVGEKNIKVLNFNQNKTKNQSSKDFESISPNKTEKQLFDSLCTCDEDILIPDITNFTFESSNKVNNIEQLSSKTEIIHLNQNDISNPDISLIKEHLIKVPLPASVTESPVSEISKPQLSQYECLLDKNENTNEVSEVISQVLSCDRDSSIDIKNITAVKNQQSTEDSNKVADISTVLSSAEKSIFIEDEHNFAGAIIQDLKNTILKTTDILEDLEGTTAQSPFDITFEETKKTSNPVKSEELGEVGEPSHSSAAEVGDIQEPEVKKIGFSEDLELDENEINKMLEELDEDDDEFKDCDTEETFINETDSNDLNELKESVDVNLPSNNEDVHQEQVSELQEPNINEINTTKPVAECMENTVVNKELNDNDKNLMLENEDVTIRENKDSMLICDQKVALPKETTQESLLRPHNLPLNSEFSEEKKRKIDLIGEPGSTPYNNVYVSKSITKQKKPTTNDSDTEYSTSASPTFSDISTESTSTASTLSVEDVEVNVTKVKLKNNQEEHGGDKGRGDEGFSENVEEGRDESAAVTEYEGGISRNPSENITDDVVPAGIAIEEIATSDMETSSGAIGGVAAGSAPIAADKSWLGKEAPLWIPDSDAIGCLHCDMKFTVIKRRHHCRACGLVLCAKCCNSRTKLEYLDAEARVCSRCYDILNKDANSSSGSEISPEASPAFRPNPNNPLEYCSTVSPLQQVGAGSSSPPSVMVPVGVLKRKGSNKSKSNKSVMFCDGIKPGSDLTNLDSDFNYNHTKAVKKCDSDHEKAPTNSAIKINRNMPKVESETRSFLPVSENSLPPTVTINKTDISYTDCSNTASVVEMLKNETLTFALQVNLYVHVKIINMSCCINKTAWCFTTEGLINVGNDEIVILLEFIDGECVVPKDLFFHLNHIYLDALKGVSTRETGISLHNTSNFLDSKNHAGFVYIRPTFQCLENVIKPNDPFLVGILIHRWETPWAKLFPLRLVLRLGAEYRYYPSPIISTRHRDSVFVEVGHTIINLLADFRNFSYTLPQIRGLIIHMEDKKTTVTIPANRYDLVVKSINNSSDHILAFAGNFSREADSHLVCIQDTQSNDNNYSTHAINIHNKPRKITGASFIVFNGALKSSSGLTAKSNIVEDGLMIQVLPEHMALLRDNLRAMKNHTIACGCVNTTTDETVNIVWGENDSNFNMGVTSPIDDMSMSGVPSIRVHNGKDWISNSGSRLIRWTEVFILQNSDETSPKNQDPVDVSKLSESIAKATSNALVKYIDLLVSNSFYKIAIRATLHVENVSYSAGSNGVKLPPIYMKSLDNELIPVLHRITSNNLGDNAIVLELIFRILNV